jgi:Immunoglobulin-like domain of bacterial spore germination
MNNFFGSKLNSVLLLVLIILMVVAIKIMLKTPDKYFPGGDETTSTEILGNKADLVSFSVLPGSKVSGLVAYKGVIKGAYFFEANILVNILDANKNVLKQGNAMATTDWMTAEPVSFEGKLDFTGLTKGPGFIEIHNDNASGLPENDKSVFVPIVIE